MVIQYELHYVDTVWITIWWYIICNVLLVYYSYMIIYRLRMWAHFKSSIHKIHNLRIRFQTIDNINKRIFFSNLLESTFHCWLIIVSDILLASEASVYLLQATFIFVLFSSMLSNEKSLSSLFCVFPFGVQ